jgi:hypothetical protein
MLKRDRTRIHLDRRNPISDGCQAAASLHCHTHFSKEILSFIPYYATRVPLLASYFEAGLERYQKSHGRPLDFGQAWWTPPVTPRQVIEIETLQIEKELGLPAMVSITDHDEIEAGLLLQVLNTPHQHPISLEWTVPFESGFFHLGIHNLPREESNGITAELMKYTKGAADARNLAELLDWLNQSPSTLIVLNHPFWDIELIGGDEHRRCLRQFIAEHGRQLHALEINGFRKWRENKETIALGAEIGLPVVSGGDRHGCQPNTLLNLTRSHSFAEMVAEIRDDGYSEILVMPGYQESMVMRVFETVAEVIGHYPGHGLGRELWSDRIFFALGGEADEPRPLSHYWPNGGPGWVQTSLWLLRRLGSKQLKAALRLALAPERIRFEYES